MADLESIYKEDTIDIKKYIFKIIANWYWFVITVFLSFSVAYFINRYSERIYQVSSSILIRESNDQSFYSDEMIQGLDLVRQGVNIQNQIGILRSFDLNHRVINELDFHISYFGIGRIREPEKYQPAFVVNLDTNHYQQYNLPIYITLINSNEYALEIDGQIGVNRTLKFGEQFENEYFSFNITIRDIDSFDFESDNKYYFYINNPLQLTDYYRRKLGIGLLDEEASVLTLSIQGYVAQKEAVYLNKLAEVFIQTEIEDKNQIAINTIKFIDDQITAIVDSLVKAEGNLQDFRTENKIIDLTQEGRNLYEQYENLENEKALLTVQDKYYQYLDEYLNSKGKDQDIIVPTSVGVRDQLLVNLIMQINQLNSEKVSLKLQSVKTNPKLNSIESKMDELKKMLTENVNNLIATNQIAIDDINSRIVKLNSSIEKLPFNERRLINIQRKFDLNDQIYTYLLEKRAEAGISMASNMPNAKVLDKARVEQAILISPKNRLNYLISLVIGLMIPFVVIVLKDYFNNKILSKKDIEEKTDAPIVGLVGHNTKDTELVVYDNPKSAISESFRTIKTNLQYLLLDKNAKIITVTSTMSGEGKTFCSLNLASIIAMTDKKTLLVGMDLRKPKIHRHFEIDNSIGLSSYLIGKESIENVIFSTGVEGLFIVPSGPVPPNPAKLLETQALDDFIKFARDEYDYIVVDTPPIALVSDALLFSKHSDINLFVIRQNYSHKDVLDLINDLNKKPNIPEFNILINDVRVPGYYGKRYGYGYGYDYGYGYGYSYGYGSGYYDDEKEITILEKIAKTLKKKKN